MAAQCLGAQGQIAFQDHEFGGRDLPCPEFQTTLDTAALIETPSTLKGRHDQIHNVDSEGAAARERRGVIKSALEKNRVPLFKNEVPLWL